MNAPSQQPSYVVSFDDSADRPAVEAVLGQVVAAGGELVAVAGHGVIVRVAETVAEALSSHQAVDHVGQVTLPMREPVRIRRPAKDPAE